MTVYVDDANIPATVGRLRSQWSHLIADDQTELHAFAARLGLRRAWFQDPTVTGRPRAMPGSRAAENWHYDLTAGKRAQAIRLGAVAVSWRELAAIIDRRYEQAARVTSTPGGQDVDRAGPMRVLVTGGRDFVDRDAVVAALRALPADAVLVHGSARGADALAAHWWGIVQGRSVEAYPAEWDRHGKAAGVIRNQQMLDTGIDLLVAFPGGRGTADMVRRARTAGVPVQHAGEHQPLAELAPRALTPTRQRSTSTVTGPLVTAIEDTWAAIQDRHPDVPDVVLTLGNGSTRGGGLTLGHFHDRKWAADDTRLPELFIGGEGLARGPREVLGTLLHEATHGVAAARGIKDTSRQGRYHNSRFRDLATELGIQVDKHPSIGWSLTTVPEHTAELYSEQITALGAALTAHRLSDLPGPERTNNGLIATCACSPPRKIRLSRTAYDTGPIACGVCEADFTAIDTNATSTTREGRAAMTSYQHIPTETADSHDAAFDLDDQLAQVAQLEHSGADDEQIKHALRPLAERHALASNALHLRVRDHVEIARDALVGYRRDRRDYVSQAAARQRALILAEDLTRSIEEQSYGQDASEHTVLSWQITTDQIDAAPGPARRVLIGTVAAQQAIDKLRATHTVTAGEAIDLYEENWRQHGHDEDQAEAAATAEIEQAVESTYELAFDDLELSSQERAERLEALQATAERAEALVEQRRREHHEIAEIAASGLYDDGDALAAAARQRVQENERSHRHDSVAEDNLLASPVRGSDIDHEHGQAREAMIRVAAAQQAVRELRDSHSDTIEYSITEYHRLDTQSDAAALPQEVYQHATAAIDAQIENIDHRIRQTAADRDAAAQLEPDPDELAVLLAGAEGRRGVAPHKVDDIDRLRERLLNHQNEQTRQAAADPSVHQHTAALSSQAVHPSVREDDRAAASEARADGRGENPVEQARAAVERLAEHQRHVDQQRREDHARTEQLNRWHHEDRARSDSTSTRVGGRAIYGWGMER